MPLWSFEELMNVRGDISEAEKQRLSFVMLWLVEVSETYSSTFLVTMLSYALLLIRYIGYLMAFAPKDVQNRI